MLGFVCRGRGGSFRACPEAETLEATAVEGKFPGLSRGGTSIGQQQQGRGSFRACPEAEPPLYSDSSLTLNRQPVALCQRKMKETKAITSHKYCCHALSLMILSTHTSMQYIFPSCSLQPLLLELSQVSEGEPQVFQKGDHAP